MSHHTLDQVRIAKRQAWDIFKRLALVTGVGITHEGGRYGLKVNLKAAPLEGTVLPEEIDGIPIRIEITGPIRWRDDAGQ